MLTAVEILYALRGLARLIRFDAQGLEFFDRSIQGFWRSFRVALLVAPFYAVLIPPQLEKVRPTVGWPNIIAIEILTYVIAWFLYPVVAYELCRWLGREKEYPGYIAVYNWSAVIPVAAKLLVWLPTFAGVTATDTSAMMTSAVFLAFHLYLWFVARVGLRLDAFAAAGLTLADFLLAVLLSTVYVMMMRAG